MWAEVNLVEMCSQFVEALVNPMMKRLKFLFCVIAARDARLARDNHGAIAQLVSCTLGQDRIGL
jgi:hypothetical protein